MLIPQTNYYYLANLCYVNFKQGFRVTELQRDIMRGVTTLSESAYTDYYGSTQTSLKFLLTVKTIFGRQLFGKKATMTFSTRHHYKLRVETHCGYTLVFDGVSAGYYGEGTRGCVDILKALGFTEKQCERVFLQQEFRFVRSVNPMANATQ